MKSNANGDKHDSVIVPHSTPLAVKYRSMMNLTQLSTCLAPVRTGWKGLPQIALDRLRARLAGISLDSVHTRSRT